MLVELAMPTGLPPSIRKPLLMQLLAPLRGAATADAPWVPGAPPTGRWSGVRQSLVVLAGVTAAGSDLAVAGVGSSDSRAALSLPGG